MEYLFGPRFMFFEYVPDIPQHEEKRSKVEVGRKIDPENLRLSVSQKMSAVKIFTKRLFDQISYMKLKGNYSGHLTLF